MRWRVRQSSLDLASFVSLPFIESMDPAIKHQLITSAEAVSPKDPRATHNQHPLRRWCEARPVTICIRSRYQFEGKLPLGIQIANKLRDSPKKIADYLEFESELTLRSPAEVARWALRADRARYAIDRGARAEHLLCQPGDAVRQAIRGFPAPSDRRQADRGHSIHGARGRDEHARQEEGIRKVPVLRNLVPAQVLCRQELVQLPEIRSAPGCQSMPATRSRRSPRSLDRK